MAGGSQEGKDALLVHAYILLDRSGSMQSLWTEALSSVNAYAKELDNKTDGDAVDAKVTLAVFDDQAGMQFDVLRKDVPALHWQNVTDAEASPRGMTPLLDAIGRVVSLAETDNPDKAIIVVMTDGMENASREVTREGAKAALDRVRKKGWEVVFLGANFDNISDAQSVGVGAARQMSMAPGHMDQTMRMFAKKSRGYFARKAAVEFDEADRETANEAAVKNRNS